MPDARYEEIVCDAPERDGENYGLTANTFKLEKWVEFAEGCDDELILADCDMLMLNNAAHAFGEDFDIAYTERTSYSLIPLNGGIIFVRPTEGARGFLRKLRDVNNRMYYEDKKFRKEWQEKYPGMNQAAMGYLLESGDHEAKIQKLYTRTWNAVECDWKYVNADETVFLHIKGRLRDDLLRMKPPNGDRAEAMKLWYEISGRPEMAVYKFKGTRKQRRMNSIHEKLCRRMVSA